MSGPHEQQRRRTTGPPEPNEAKRQTNQRAALKHKELFETEHLVDDLKGRSVRGGAATMFAQGTKFFTKLGSTVVLARLLTPRDFGLIAMVTALTGLAAMFKDMGLSMATVQRSKINHAQISGLFWINVGLSTAIMLLTVAAAPLIVWFYGEPRLAWITVALSASFLFGGLTVQHQALLRRQMRFGALAFIDVASILAGVVVAIIAAWLGASYWALVLMNVTTALTNAAAVWILCPWIPGLPVRGSGVRSMLAFGGHLTGFKLIGYIGANIARLLIGRNIGSAALGLYSRAYGLLLMPLQQINTPVTHVAIPTLSRLKDDPERHRAYYRKGLSMIHMLGMPIVAFTFVAADMVVLIVLGEQWLEAIPIFRFLGPAALIATTNVATGWAYISLGRVRRQLFGGAMGSFLTMFSVIIGIRWGAMGVAAALSVNQLLFRIPIVLFCYWGSLLRLRDFLYTVWRPALASIAAGALLFRVGVLFPSDMNILVKFLVSFSLYSVFYAILWLLLPGGRKTLVDFLLLIRELKAQKTSCLKRVPRSRNGRTPQFDSRNTTRKGKEHVDAK